MIVGIGVDVVDLARFERALARTPRLLERLFAEDERRLALRSLAGRFAAKEALIKALGGIEGMHWSDIEVVVDGAGNPDFRVAGAVADVLRTRGIDRVHLSMAHDGGVAVAHVVAERTVQP